MNDNECCRTAYSKVPWQFVRGAVFIASWILLLLAVLDSRTLRSGWYHALEGLVGVAFCGEVLWRIRISRADSVLSWSLMAEVAVAVLCLFTFAALIVSSSMDGTEALQEGLLVLMCIVQSLRLLLALKSSVQAEHDKGLVIQVQAVRHEESEHAELRAVGQVD